MKNLLILVGVSLTVLGPSYVRAEDKPPPAAAGERVDLAKRIYKGRIAWGLHRRLEPPNATNVPFTDPLINESMAEELHTWSVRWMEAERDGAADQTGRVAAAQAHLDRMISVESGKMVRKELADHPLVKELDENKNRSVDYDMDVLRKLPPDEVGLPEATRRFPDVARYFRLEAEAWLAREKAGR